MKFTEIKGFNLTGNYITSSDYLNSRIIEEFDCLGILDTILALYVDEAIADKQDMLANFGDFSDLYSDVAEEVCNKLTITDIWGLCTIYTTDMFINYSNTCLTEHIDDMLIQITNKALYELICYKPVADFLNKELAMYIYKHTHGNVAQFPYATISSYIETSTYTDDIVQELINYVEKAE